MAIPLYEYQLAEEGVIRMDNSQLITRDMPDWIFYRVRLQSGYVPYPMALPDGPTVAEVLQEIKTLITIKRDEVQNGGATIASITYKTDATSLSELAQALQLSALQPARTFYIKTADMEHIAMTAAEISDLFDALGERVALCWDNEAAHYAAATDIMTLGISDSTKISALRAYDFTTGWPT